MASVLMMILMAALGMALLMVMTRLQ